MMELPFFAAGGDDHAELKTAFVDRHAERSRFHEALKEHLDATTAGLNDPTDLRSGRANVMVTYGVAGYGKTALSKHLEAELQQEGQGPTSRPPFATARVDLAPHIGADLQTILLTIRASVVSLGRLPAFDVAFSKCWEMNNPGRPLADYVGSQGALRKITDALQLPDQLRDSVDAAGAELLQGAPTVAGAGVRIFAAIGKALRESKEKRAALSRCPKFADILERGELHDLPYLLAWELWHKDAHLVVFIDSFEEAASRGNHALEQALNALVWEMPNAFFLIGGRNRVDWGKNDVPRRLPAHGPESWPTLERGAQHRLATLGDEDADQLLAARLTRVTDGNEEPVIPREIRQAIVARAEGWPEYLDLALTLVLKAGRQGRMPVADEFDGEYGRLMFRLCQDMDRQEQDVLRAISLLGEFTVKLAAATANAPEGTVRAVAERSLVLAGKGFWPYFMTGAVRRCIREAQALEHAWTETDWETAAQRAVDRMGALYRDARDERNREATIQYLNKALGLAHQFGLDLTWLAAAALTYVEDYVWETTLIPDVPAAESAGEIATPAQALGLALIAIRDRQAMNRTDVRLILERCLESGKLEGQACDLVRYFRAECLRDTGYLALSESEMRDLAAPGHAMHEQAAEGVIYAQRRTGRFTDAAAGIEALPEESPIKHRLLGDLLWNHGDFRRSNDAYQVSIRLGEDQGRYGHMTEAEASRAFALAFEGTTEAQASIEQARNLLYGARIRWGELQTDNAELLLLAGSANDFDGRCQRAMASGREAGLNSITAYAAFAGAFDAAIRGNDELLGQARAQLVGMLTGEEFRYLVEIVDFWGAAPDDGRRDPGRTDWLQGGPAVRERWRAVVEIRQSARVGI